LPTDGGDTDADCQQEAREAPYSRPVKQRSVAWDGITLQLEELFMRARELFIRALDFLISVPDLIIRAREQDVTRSGLLLIQRSIH
jgi:hypothetical protein